MSGNTLYYGDNLDILRAHIPAESVDLVYLDPPFNSKRDYNVLFKEQTGAVSASQFEAFTDTWKWDHAAERTYHNLVQDAAPNIVQLVSALRQMLGTSEMFAYLVMMTARLIELHRVLKGSGSLYLHCDPTASHYLKLVLDAIFDPKNFRSEIIWKRTSAHSSANRYGPVHDVLLYYAKSEECVWNRLFQPYDEEYLETFFEHTDLDGRRWKRSDLTGAGTRNGASGEAWRGIDVRAKGRHWAYLPEELERLDLAGLIHWPKLPTGMPRLKQYEDSMPGVPLQDIWTDIKPIHNLASERLGYPTQKPLALLERIISASSNPGDVVLDPFCGCGTAVVAAQKLGRSWIGIDITYLAVNLMTRRLVDSFGEDVPFTIRGTPKDVGAARMLAESSRYQFQWWALSLVEGKGIDGEKKGADRGIDGVITFLKDRTLAVGRCLVQVKSGGVTSATVRDLRGTLEREKAEIALLVTLEETTAPMRKDAAEAGAYFCDLTGQSYPRLQLMTIAELLAGQKPQLPPIRSAYAAAQRIDRNDSRQEALL